MKLTNTLEILIVDDEAAGRGVLHKLLLDIVTVPFCIYEANSAVNALAILKEKKIQLLFLDVQMPEQNGFDLLKQITNIDFEIVFVTGYDQYAIHAFRFNALDYLLKPVEIDELKQAVTKAISRIANKSKSTENITNLLPSLQDLTLEKKVAIHVKDKVVFVEVIKISHIIASDNYSEIVTNKKENFVTPRVLKEFEFYLQRLPFFIRINRGVIVNANFIQSYSKDFPCIIEMKTGAKFEISRRKKADVLNQLEVL